MDEPQGRTTHWPRDPSAGGPSRPAEAPRVAVLSDEVLGLSRNGGIGTTYSALAELLASAGHFVDLLYAGDDVARERFEHWIQRYAERGVRLHALPPSPVPLGGSDRLAKSYRAYRWLRERAVDVVHVPEWAGLGYYAMLAKRQGSAFDRTTFCVGVHSPSAWIRDANQRFPSSVQEREIDLLEERSVAMADVVWTPSRAIRDWIDRAGWRRGDRRLDWPHARTRALRDLIAKKAADPSLPAGPVRELVFFGRLETRKGLRLFCDALDRLDRGSLPEGFRATFLGRSTRIDDEPAEDYLRRRSGNWSFPFQIRPDEDQEGALEYLRRPGRVAVLPSLDDNLLLTAIECASLSIPFIATRVGGIPETIAAADHDRVLVPPSSTELARRIERALREGMPPARLGVDLDLAEQRWIDWHVEEANFQRKRALAAGLDRSPRVSVCLVHHERPELLRQAVASLERLDYPNYEVVLVDDGSRSSGAKAALASIEARFAARRWKVIRQENRYLGAARNAAARAAEGEFLLFMDDDNLARPGELTELVRVAERTSADVVGSSMDIFEGLAEPRGDEDVAARWLFPPPDPALGIFQNCFGDANALVRRSVFFALGGFTEDVGVTHEEWELFAKAALAGRRIEILPDPVFYYRFDPGSMVRTTSAFANHRRSLRPYLADVPETYRPLVELAHGQALRLREVEEGLRRAEAKLKSLGHRVVDRIDSRLSRAPAARRTVQAAVQFGAAAARSAARGGSEIGRQARRLFALLW